MTKSTNSSATHMHTERATTLNRHYVRRPGSFVNQSQPKASKTTAVSPSITTASQVQAAALKRRQALAAQMNRQNLANLNKRHTIPVANKPTPRKLNITSQPAKPENIPTPEPPIKSSRQMSTTSMPKTPTRAASTKMQQPQMAPAMPQTLESTVIQPSFTTEQLLAQAKKNQATESALLSATLQSSMDGIPLITSQMPTRLKKAKKSQKSKQLKKANKPLKSSRSGRHFILAFAASAACIVLLGIVVKINMPDLSVQVAAMQTGIDAKYPSFLPNGFQLSGVSTEKNGPIHLEFTGQDGASFIITEERSAWDSNALLNNYVKDTWGQDYSVLREQGITTYISNSDAVWVNGGIFYKLTSKAADTLNKRQIKNIVTSL